MATAGRAHSRSRLIVLLPVFALAVWASIFVYAHTTSGMTTTADSASYIGTARSIRAGHGPTVPFTAVWDTYSPKAAVGFDGRVPSAVFPAGYPFALAATATVSGNVNRAARGLDVVLAFVNVLLIGIFTARLTSYRSAVVAAIPPALLLFTPEAWGVVKAPSWLQLSTAVESDALYMALATGTLLALHTALTGPRRTAAAMTIVVAVLAGLSFLTRYAGIAVAATVFFGFAALGRDERVRSRLARATIVTAVAFVPIAAYLLWIRAEGGNSARSVGVHWLNGTGAAFAVFGRDFLPHSSPGWLRTVGIGVLLAFVVAAALYTPRRLRAYWSDGRPPDVLLRLGVAFVLLTVVTLVVTRAFFDASVPVDARTLAPARGIAYAIVVAALYRWLAPYVPRAAGVLALVGLALIVSNWNIERRVFRAATGSHARRTSAEQAIANLPAGALIGTNAPDQVYLQAGRSSFLLPFNGVYGSAAPNRNFDAQMRAVASIMTARPSYVYLGLTGLVIAPGPDVIGRYMRLRLIARTGWQVLYDVEPKRR